MKKINLSSYIWALASILLIASCGDPLQDDLDRINAATAISKDLTYTMTGDDYEAADDACSCARFGNFSSEEDAKVGIPAALVAAFPALGKGSSAKVTYDIFNGSSPDLRGTQFVYTVTDAEYTELGFGFGNFSNLGADLPTYANFKEPGAGDGDYMDITHEYFNAGSTTTVTNRAVYTVAYGWQYAWVLPDAAYGDFFGESGIDFSNDDEGRDKMPVYLNEFNSNFVDEGTTLVVQYNHDNDNEGPTPDVGLYIFNGTVWLLYNDHYQITQNELNLGHNGTTWVPDNTIKYTLSAADYTAIGNAYANSNSAGSASMLQFGNYDVTLWTDAQVQESISARLVELFPTVTGQKYLVTFAEWQPGNGTNTIHLIWNGTAYEVVSEG